MLVILPCSVKALKRYIPMHAFYDDVESCLKSFVSWFYVQGFVHRHRFHLTPYIFIVILTFYIGLGKAVKKLVVNDLLLCSTEGT